jgi:hypothetical protein
LPRKIIFLGDWWKFHGDQILKSGKAAEGDLQCTDLFLTTREGAWSVNRREELDSSQPSLFGMMSDHPPKMAIPVKVYKFPLQRVKYGRACEI